MEPVAPTRRRHRHPGAIPLQAAAPKAGWPADCKGPFRTGEGLYGSPLTGAAAYRRFLFSCSARLSGKQGDARPLFERLWPEYGGPEAVRTANGAPFATPAFCGLSTRSVWWINLGLHHQRLAPGRPAQHGAPARMHRPLPAEATRPPEDHPRAQQARGARFCCDDTTERPHEALDYQTPASHDRPSPRPLPTTLPAPTSPGH